MPNAQASAAEPTSATPPFILTAAGMVNGPAYEASSAVLNSVSSSNFTDFFLSPGVMLDFEPGGILSAATFGVGQGVSIVDTESGSLGFGITINGMSAGAFAMDPVAKTMSLMVGADDSGSIFLSARATFCPSCGPDRVTVSDTLIDYEFQNGVVTVSSNSLGLGLPLVGSSANFALSTVGPFDFAFPTNLPGNNLNLFDGPMTNTLFQSAQIATPEPGTFGLTLATLVGLVRLFAQKRKRYTQTNAPLSGSRLPSAPGA